jgi:hypothetical protein
MPSRVAICYRAGLQVYDFGAGHPFRGRRFPQFYLIVHEWFKRLFLVFRHEKPIFRRLDT